MRTFARLGTAGLSGALIAWMMTAVVSYASFAAGGYTPESLVELTPRSLGLIGGGGALMALISVWVGGRSALPGWVRPAALGGLAGVAAVVIPTVGIACALGGPSSMVQSRYLHSGLVYGVPMGLLVGMFAGRHLAQRPDAEPTAEVERGRM